jgi:hypothetical protein
MSAKATIKRMKEYRDALARLGGANIGPNLEKDAQETAEAMNELAHCSELFLVGLAMAYSALQVVISYDWESESWIVCCITKDGKRLRAEADTLSEAALALGEQTK